jgi:hypothetical protein
VIVSVCRLSGAEAIRKRTALLPVSGRLLDSEGKEDEV